jgi:hypothetical protein
MATRIPNTTDLELVIEHAQTEVGVLVQQRAEITKRLTVLRRTILDLARIFGPDGSKPLTLIRPRRRTRQTGLTETCRSLLMQTSQPLTAHEVVKQIEASHANLIYHHKDPIASVTSILLRLESYGEATSDVTSSRRRLWMSKKSDQT